MSREKTYKLAVLLAAGWFVVDLALFVTDTYQGNEIRQFWSYLLAGWTLIGLSTFGYRWVSSAG